MDWASAYKIQARSDLTLYERVGALTLPSCHQLHYLQMWLGKLCKSYMVPQEFAKQQFEHGVVSKVFPRLIQQELRRTPSNMADLRRLCRQVDLLHPQIDDAGRRPDNVEYPWLDQSGKLQVPAQENFRLARELHTSQGKQLLRIAKDLTNRT